MNRSRTVATVVAGAAILSACGSDTVVPAATPPPAASSVDSTTNGSVPTTDASTLPALTAAPTTEHQTTPDVSTPATIAPDLPAEYQGEIGPVAVSGDALPALGQATIEADPARGLLAPTLIGQDYDGHAVSVEPGKHGPMMVVFLAHWCPHCNAEVPRINELRDAGRFPADLQIVAVSTAVAPGRPNFPPSQWVHDVDWTYPVLADGVDMQRQTFIAAAAFGVDGFPFIALLDTDGKVVARWSGESTPDEIIARITEYLPAA